MKRWLSIPLLVGALMATAATPARAQAGTRWEYGELSIPGQGKSYWATSQGFVWADASVGEPLADFAKKLGVTKTPTEGASWPFVILDRLGAQGWEVVAVEAERTYLLKRRR